MNGKQILDGMKGQTTGKHLPKWIPHPAQAEVEKDFQHERAAADRALAGKLTAQDWRDHEALMAHYGAMTLDGKPQAGAVDWRALHALIPWLAVLGAWAMWAMFLLIPTAFGLHYAGMFPAASNWLYVGMGLTLCLAATVAAQVQHGARAILFTFSVLLLSYWF